MVKPVKSKKSTTKGKSKKAVTTSDKEQLISEVSKQVVLWKKELDGYHNREVCAEAWNHVSAATGIPADECKAMWKNLRDSFASKLRRIKAGKSGDGLEDVQDGSKARKWVYFDQMMFLEDSLSFRETSTNYQNDETEDGNDELGTWEAQQSKAAEVANEEGQVKDPGPSKTVTLPQKRKQSSTDILFDKIATQMDVVNEVLRTPDPPVTKADPFLEYLGQILASVPTNKKRKCEQSILLIANAFADGTDDSIQIVAITSA